MSTTSINLNIMVLGQRGLLECYLLDAQVDFIVVLCVKMYAGTELLTRRERSVHVTGIRSVVHG